MVIEPVYTLHRGSTPLLVSVPHAGTALTPELHDRLLPRAAGVEDTDWHLDRLYDVARDLGASLIAPRYSRYVIDLNRPPDNTAMVVGANNTELAPTRFFTGAPLYREDCEPDASEVEQRVEQFWRPYHGALRSEIERLQAEHGHAVLLDAHSIKSELPWLFEGTLPHLNLGTAKGSSCAPALADALAKVLREQQRYSHVIDGRFQGGDVTRDYGQPDAAVHAVQLEMCWRCYLDESRPTVWSDDRAAEVTPLLRSLLQVMIDWRA